MRGAQRPLLAIDVRIELTAHCASAKAPGLARLGSRQPLHIPQAQLPPSTLGALGVTLTPGGTSKNDRIVVNHAIVNLRMGNNRPMPSESYFFLNVEAISRKR